MAVFSFPKPPSNITSDYGNRWLRALCNAVQKLQVGGSLEDFATSTTSEETLFFYDVPARLGKGDSDTGAVYLELKASGKFATVGNKSLALKIGSNSIFTFGPVSLGTTNWSLEAQIFFRFSPTVGSLFDYSTIKLFTNNTTYPVTVVNNFAMNLSNETVEILALTGTAAAGTINVGSVSICFVDRP